MASKGKDEKYASIVKSRYRKAAALAEERFDQVELNRTLYKGQIQTDDTYEWDYSLVDQQIFPLIRNYVARSNPAMTKVRLEARKSEDFERRQVNQDFVNWEINELSLTQLLTRGFFSNYVAGKGYFKTGWKYDPRVVVKNGQYEYEMRPLINRADLKFVPFNHILIPNRNIPELNDQPYIIELMQIRVGDMLNENEALGYEYWDKKFISKLKKEGIDSKMLNYEADFVKDEDTLDDMTFRAASIPTICMWTKDGDVIYVPLTGDTDAIMNKERSNPYWHGHYPYIDMTAFPEDDEFFSMSVVDATGDFQIAGTEVLNQTLTNIRSLNNNMWVTGETNVTTPDYMFVQRPSGVIRVAGNPSETVPIRPNDATSSMIRMGQEIANKLEKVGGISSLYSSGVPGSNINQTARGAQIISQNIETNIKMIMDLFGEQVLKKIGEHFLELNAQFVTEEQTFAVTGKKGVRELVAISPDQISANFDVYTMPESMVKQTPASRQASLQNLLTVINQQVVPNGVSVDIVPLAENLIDAYPDMENVDDIVVSIDEKAKRDSLMLERGQMPEIKARDDHKSLIQIVSIYFEDNQQNYAPETQALFQKYVERHLQFLQAEQMIKQMSAMPQQGMSPNGVVNQGPEAGMIPENMGTGEPTTPQLGDITGGGQAG